MKTHIPRKRFGQHFLSDQGIIDGIVQAIDILEQRAKARKRQRKIVSQELEAR